MLLFIISILSYTFAYSWSIRLASSSVFAKEALSMISCSASFLRSAFSSLMRSSRNSISFLRLASLSCKSSDFSCSFFVSLRTPEISDSIYRISSLRCLMSSLMAWRALSRCCIPNRLFYQSSSKVFLLMTIRSISMAASLRVFLAAAVSSFWDMSWAWYKVFYSFSRLISSFIVSISKSCFFLDFSRFPTFSSAR